MTARRSHASGSVAALPLAATATLLLVRALPVRFAFEPSPLGIVSVATETRYPAQQELFWLGFALAFGTLTAWALARTLARDGLPAWRGAALEGCAALALAAVLLLPTAAGLAATLACVGLAAAAAGAPATPAREPGTRAPGREDDTIATPAARTGGPLRAWTRAAFLLVLALLVTPGFLARLWSAAQGVPDEARTVDSFVFQGEMGQHLAWADALRRGQLHGRDFFCLYGPLYDLGTVAWWTLFGRSIAGFELWFQITRALGLASLLWLAAGRCSRPAFALAIPALVPWVSLRIGLPLLGLAALCGWIRSGRRAAVLGAGALAGASLLYSQEFGLALVVAAAAAFALHRDLRSAALFAAAALAVTGPVLGWYAARGALLPMLRELAAYPGYVMAGYAKLPFPSLAAAIPLGLDAFGTQPSLLLRLGHAAPAACWAALLLALGIERLDARHPIASARAFLAALRRDARRQEVALCALFGLLCFRSALGRSDLVHVIGVLAPAALLLVVAADRLLEGWRSAPGLRPVVLARAVALCAFVLLGGFLEAPRPIRAVDGNLRDAALVWRGGAQAPAGSAEVMRVVRWLQLRLRPGDGLLALPNDAAYYYLLDRPSPIRFVMGHQIVTTSHREEVLDALRSEPPRFVIWDDGALRVDDLPDERVFGAPLLEFLSQGYEEAARLGSVRVLELRASASGAPEARAGPDPSPSAAGGRPGGGSHSGASRPSAIAPTPPAR